MADGPKPEEAVATVQMPRGAKRDEPAPLQATIAPPADSAIGAPPPIPQELKNAIGGKGPEDWRYAIKVEIARGGMGRVVEATDTVLGRNVALKEALSLDPDAIRRFQRETRITARLEHPSIVPVHDAGISPDGAPFYVMRKIGGRPLEELVVHTDALPERLALLPHIVAAAHAIAHAHERGIVHRDIKPANILVGELGETIVIDWGLAKTIGEADDPHHPGYATLRSASGASPPSTSTPSQARFHADPPSHSITSVDDAIKTRAGTVFGTPGFMSPEQLRGAPADERCDVYALGATLYHLLARKPPHHAHTADEMMKAAVTGPPKALRDLVSGVPPELATIVEKSLAPDAAARYQNARALAEDLQRFLTGQLVASHHYSRREKIVRYVRRNRALVGVAAAAVLAIAIGSWVAIGRILAARDRADEQARIALDQKMVAEEERESAIDRLAQLTLKDARSNADADPTRAIAMIEPLVKSRRWREVRAIGAAALARGVAFGLPGSPHTLSLEMSRDGQRALAAGDDGAIRIYDLVRRTAQTIGDAKAPAIAHFADGERSVVWFRERHIAIADLAASSRRDVTAPTSIVKLEISGPNAYWTDTDGAVWRLDLAAGAPQKIELDEPVSAVVPSPDGRWIALAGVSHLMLLDRTQPTLPPEAKADGTTRDLAWADDASHLVALIDQEVVDIEMEPAPTLVHRQTVGNRYSVSWSTGRIFSAGPTGVAVLTHDEARARKVGGDHALGVHEARGGIIVSGGQNGTLTVLSDDGDQQLTSPLAPISHIAASPRSSWVLASGEGRVLVWNLDDVVPLHAAQTPPSGARFVTGDTLIETFVDEPARWLDLRTGKSQSLGMIPGLAAVAPAPDGESAVVIDGTHHARIVTPVGAPVDIAGEIEYAAFAGQQLAVATSDGTIKLDDHVLAHRRAGVVAFATSGDWIAAAFGDRTLWRAKVSGGEATLGVTSPPPHGAFVLTGDGSLVFAVGGEVRAWRADGSKIVLATIAKPVVAISLVAESTALALTSEGTAWLVDTRAPGAAEPTVAMPAATELGSGEVVATIGVSGALDIVDPVAKQRWTIAAPRGFTYGFAQVSPGEARVLATTPTSLLVWTIALPHGADATAAWLGKMTNALADHGPTAPLGWR